MKVQTAKINVGVGKSSKKDLSKNYLTTMGFYRMTPIFYDHLTALDSIEGSHRLFSRLAPLVLPAMVDAEYHVNDFFVRYKDVWPLWDYFENHLVYAYTDGTAAAIPIKCPLIRHDDLESIFITPANGLMTTVASSSTDYDVLYTGGNKYKFTLRGSEMYKMLCNLGYRILWNGNKFEYNALPLLCYIKVWIDYYFPPEYKHSVANLNDIFVCFNYTGDHSTHPTIVKNAITKFLLYGGAPFYNDDSFTSVWERPDAPVQGVQETFSHTVVTGIDTEIISNSNATEFTPVLAPGNIDISDLGIKWLQKFTNFVKKQQLTGSRLVNRFLAQYGIKLDDVHEAIHLNRSIIPIKIGDIECNSNSSNGAEVGVVGDLSGKAVAVQSGLKFKYKAGAHAGMFISVLSCVANSRFGTGIDRNNLHQYQKDFYTPEFDALGTAGVTKSEVFTCLDYSKNDDPLGIFGFLPRYYEYIFPQDVLSGDFIIPRRGADQLSGYHLFRAYLDDYIQSNLISNFSFREPTDIQRAHFNRIFYNGTAVDQFIVKFNTEFSKYGPKKQLKDNFEFVGDEDNKQVEIEAMGSHVN